MPYKPTYATTNTYNPTMTLTPLYFTSPTPYPYTPFESLFVKPPFDSAGLVAVDASVNLRDTDPGLAWAAR